MIRTSNEELIKSNAQALVNTVNTVGVMGKGVALLFKEKFPENYKQYRKKCKKQEIVIGKMYIYTIEPAQPRMELGDASHEQQHVDRPKWIINFPTKKHWRSPSKIEWIEQGLIDLKRVIKDSDIRSIALPQLGCGNGGLDWKEVKPLIEEAFKDSLEVEVTIHVYQETGVE